MKDIIISSSILSSDFSNLLEDLLDMKNSGADWMHYDVMDGHFVNNISFGPDIIKSVANKVGSFIDIHLMIEEPVKYIDKFLEIKPNLITVHQEVISIDKFVELKKKLNDRGCKIGISFRPCTKIDENYLKYADVVLVMSVEPGFGGQSFIEESYQRISYINKYKENYNLKYLIEVDGGINDLTGKKCVESGADILVSGSYLFKAQDRRKAIKLLKGEE